MTNTRLRFKTKTGNVFFVDGIGILRSTRTEKFSLIESTLIWHTFSRNCCSERAALVALPQLDYINFRNFSS